VRLTITRNRVSTASVRWDGAGLRVRLHEAFLAAPERVWDALAEFVRGRSRTAWAEVAAFARSIRPVAAEATGPRRTRGRVFDLASVQRAVNERHFGGAVRCHITWGRPGRRPRRARSRSIRFGTYVESLRLVRVNPILDDPRVPREFVEYIVFHEMLHAVAPSETAGSRRHHHVAFRALERRYPDLARMRRLSQSLLKTLV